MHFFQIPQKEYATSRHVPISWKTNNVHFFEACPRCNQRFVFQR